MALCLSAHMYASRGRLSYVGGRALTTVDSLSGHSPVSTPCLLCPQKRTFPYAQAMSALPPKADMCDATRDVRFGPKADIQSRLFDDPVGSGEQRRGYGETERLCCLQVYGEFVFAWGLHRQISRFLAP